MYRVWKANDIGKLIGISGHTVKCWAERGLIPQPSLQGLLKTRVWGKTNTLAILEFAKNTAGYFVPERCFEEVKGERETSTKM